MEHDPDQLARIILMSFAKGDDLAKITNSWEAQWQTADKQSFAYPSARDRWPVIITQAIDDVHRACMKEENEEKRKEGKVLLDELAQLKYELQHDRVLVPLKDDGESDIKTYNDELEARKNPNWFNVAWLYSECYMYRRMAGIFKRSSHWKSYDYFLRSKLSGFRSSRRAVIELATRYKEIVTQLEQDATLKGVSSKEELEEAERLLFKDMCEICLWGNATDLSLMTDISAVDFSKIQGKDARQASEKNVLVNDLDKVFAVLNEAKKNGDASSERRVDFVLDNAGFELFVDLILAGYLVASGLATTVVLHPKDIPWFVSDVTPNDFGQLISILADPQPFFSTTEDGEAGESLSTTDAEAIQFLFKHWSGYHADGRLVIRPNICWTGPGSFWRLKDGANEVFEDLKQSELVVFKGDLNYRKLTADATWPADTPFADAIGPLGRGSGLRVMALRTCKGDVICGLPQGKDEELRAAEGGGGDSGARKWAWTGKYAVIQFWDGKAD